MSDRDPNYASVAAFVDEMVRAGVRDACVSPGARSTPLALALADHRGIRAWSHVDERSGAFFALGMSKAARRPAVAVCTSGTAAANFFPAVIEATCAHVPLVVLTADRPAELRDCGARQTIDQIKLYGSHVKWFAEAGPAELGTRYFRALACRAVAAALRGPPGPVHVNFPLREPLVPPPGSRLEIPGQDENARAASRPYTVAHSAPATPAPATIDALAAVLAGAERGLIACGSLDPGPGLAESLTALAARLRYPILADPLSQLRSGRHQTDLVVGSYDALLRDQTFARHLAPDLVLRLGPMLTSKAFLEYCARHSGCRQIVIDPHGFWNDPTLTATDIVHADPEATCCALLDQLPPARSDTQWRSAWMEAEWLAVKALAEWLRETAEIFEGKVFAELPSLLPDGALLYVGNSMSVRDLESFWPVGRKRLRLLCNRGANGIDGLVSSGLGAAAACGAPLVMVTGDLGFYHDLNGLLAIKRYGLRATIVVLNNDGGGIFSFLPQAECGQAFEEFFLTPHGLDFRGAVEMYGARFTRIASWEEFRAAVRAAVEAPFTTVVEVPIERTRSVALHRETWAAVREAIARGR